MLSNETLINYYKVSFTLRQHHGYHFEDMDNMFPFEKEIYLSLLLDHLQKEQERLTNNG